ncbi:uncharacterized protein SPAPADRAFT_132572 [Spathaspora passalidarum NRRL Y-27907]|uniref:LicD/FKTN/FKRP nucleotidyltransferase domain-containing protein n=1 Tax=Spathaspora passalidarum (strain NRRL Y-27907 / 11-Y1) TaxID=619300 RepID=G3AEX8_SPAPN|nr:uncharacterized protein SPAPADRAFT_132572 [Spathaspora passalidarum NRRL Y-27907]EGW35808.1 hypothetical protein SPAPADRAFT_132572 [Spathaspora passalidarum NRRL Y-27907]
MSKNISILIGTSKFYKPILFILLLNTLVISIYSSLRSRDLYAKEIYLNDISTLPQVSFTNSEISQKLMSLLAKFRAPTVTSEITVPTNYFDTDEIVQDPRIILSITLNWMYHQIKVDQKNISFPFNWADWVDLTYLNHQISKPENERIKCLDLIEHIHFNTPDDKAKSIADPMFFGCKNAHDLTKREMKALGLSDLDKMPGFFQFEHTAFKSSEFIRLLQGKTYLLSKMPIPYQVIFLNDNGNDLIFKVDSKMNGSELMKKYITNNNLGKQKDVTLDTIQEFKQIRSLLDVDTNEKMYNAKKILRMNKTWFHYGPDDVKNEITKLSTRPSLTPVEQGYLYSLITSKAASETPRQRELTYFQLATLITDDTNKDDGWHYDWRFINGKWRDRYRHALLLERLLRNWFKFCQKNGIVSWINFGSLLGWYRNGAIYPFDLDMDIQMPIHHMTILGRQFNQTLVVEDLREGTGKYLIDVGTYIHNRYTTRDYNHIDARFIDVDSGLYIDLTALSTSKDGETELYNDRHNWVYKFSDLSPLRLSLFEGIPFHVPKQIVKRMKFQYRCGTLNNFEFKHWYYVNQVGTWIHEKELLAVLDVKNYIEDGKVNKHKVKKQVENLTDEQLYTIISNDPATLSNYQLARRNFAFHTKEHQFLFKIDPKLHKNANDPPEGKVLDASPEENPEYIKLIEDNVWLRAPHRESICQFDKVKGKLIEYNQLAFRELDQITVSQEI